MRRWWLSFVDPHKPEGAQFLGCCIVEAHDFIGAVRVAHALGCNPGGEVQGLDIPAEMQIDRKYLERLLTRKECEEFDAEQQAKGWPNSPPAPPSAPTAAPLPA